MSSAPTTEAPNKPRAVREPVRRVVNESGIEVKPLYTAEDVAASGPPDNSRPGEPPFTRGIHPLMYRHRPWTMRQYTGFANAADTNQRFKYLIANGQTGLNVAFDLATQCGYDSNAPEAMVRSAASAWLSTPSATLRSLLTASISMPLLCR